jgi:hypothetical protein
MVNRCRCGRFTDFGTMCVSCTMATQISDPDINLNMEDFIEEEEEEEDED